MTKKNYTHEDVQRLVEAATAAVQIVESNGWRPAPLKEALKPFLPDPEVQLEDDVIEIIESAVRSGTSRKVAAQKIIAEVRAQGIPV